MLVWKFLASTSLGMCAVQSVSYVEIVSNVITCRVKVCLTNQKGRVFTEITVGEHEQELGAVSRLVGRLERVRHSGREVPKITRPLISTN